MDEEKDTQDLTVGSDGMMSTENKNEEVIQPEGEQDNSVNEVTPPPQDEAIQDIETNSTDEVQISGSETEGESISVRTQPEETPEETIGNDTNVPHEDVFSEPSQPDDVVDTSMESTPVSPVTADEQQGQTKHSGQVEARTSEHPNNKKFIAFVVVLVAILLMGAAVFIYMSAEDNAAPAPTPVPTVQEQEPEPLTPAAESDVDQTVQELDEALNELDDTEDFSDEALSDEALGL